MGHSFSRTRNKVLMLQEGYCLGIREAMHSLSCLGKAVKFASRRF